MKKIIVFAILAALAAAPSWAMPVIEFSPDPSTAGNWSYNGAIGVLSFDQDIAVDKAISSTSDALVNAHVYLPSFYVSGESGVYSLTTLGSSEIRFTDATGSVTYMTGSLGNGYLNTIGTVAVGYSQFASDITNVQVTPEGQALGSGVLDLLSYLSSPDLDFDISLQGGNGANYHSFAAMIDGGFSGTSGFSGSMSVPEPTTIALFGIGSLALAHRRRRVQVN
ncbi:MAG: PEP-CTERM sorting domain-containing protein [Phycisphaerae bacterium]|nr:PEP-CTERM sorting domain-containing protein [Phycisphaerae bacterium]